MANELVIKNGAKITGALDMSSNAINNPTTVGGSSISGLKLNGLPTAADGDISANTHKITSVVDPAAAQDAATKNYVDTKYYGDLYVSSAAATTLTANTTFYLVAGTTAVGSSSAFTQNNAGRLTYTGTPTRIFHVTMMGCLVPGGINRDYHVRVCKNAAPGGLIAESEISVKSNSNSDDVGIFCQAIVSLATNDYIEIFLKSDTNSDTGTMERMNLNVIQL